MIELGGELGRVRVKTAIQTPNLGLIEIGDRLLAEVEVERWRPLVQDLGGLVGMSHDETRTLDARRRVSVSNAFDNFGSDIESLRTTFHT